MRAEVESNDSSGYLNSSSQGPSSRPGSVPGTPRPEDDQSAWARQEQQVRYY